MNQDIVFSQKHPGFLKSPTGRLVSADFIIIPNYQDLVQVKQQIRWCENVAEFFADIDEGLTKEYKDFADLLKTRLQKLAR